MKPAWPGPLLSWRMSKPITLRERKVSFDPTGPGAGGLNLWLYRRIADRKNFKEGTYRGDVCLVNWPPSAWREMAPPFAKVVSGLVGRGFKGPFVLADGRPVHDAGGSEVQELAFALSLAVAYLRMLEAGGMALDAARAALSFRLVADADQFLTMAKFRALRLLSARIEQACGLTPSRSSSPRRPHGAADPARCRCEHAARHHRDLRRRVSRRQRHHRAAAHAGMRPARCVCAARRARHAAYPAGGIDLAKVSDPAAGSGGIESLTEDVCAAAWALYQEIEMAGSVFDALQQGLIQGRVAATRSARDANIARRKDA